VPQRGREAQYVNVLPFQDVLEYRPLIYDARRDRLVRLHPVAIGAHDVERMRGHRKSEQDRQPLRGVGRAGEGAESLRVAGNVLEQNRRRIRLAVDDLRERAHLELPVCAADAAQLARAL
jgi:hypothetical protein